MRFGGAPGLAVRGRTSGRWRTVPVNVLELEGQRYLVAPRGETQWARNLRATGRQGRRPARALSRQHPLQASGERAVGPSL